MRPDFRPPPKLSSGDRVAVVSPSFAAPALFPAVHELGLRRLREEFGLEPVEYPATRRQATPAERAADLMDAYADPDIRAVFATIGGDDQITVLRHLDPGPFTADPKPFFGYSDNTNLLNWLWHHGVAGYHGMSTMVHLGRGAGVQPVVAESLRAALFTGGDLVVRPVAEFSDEEVPWTEPAALTTSAPAYPSPERVWHRADRVVSAPTWGGNLEILHWTLAANRWVRPAADYAGCVLLLETSEEMPPGTEVFRMLRNFGERGLLEQFPAVVVGTAKGTSLHSARSLEQRAAYREEQRAAVLRAFEAYHPEAMIVFGVDFGHTDPQWVLPYGGRLTVDGPARTVTAHY
ncbi:LD-carboxypeptidase [Couchioplanes caeruleus]|uniref:S66 peptidase family protein n=1 Tax=Couchioplanes caeruleus TaxID=56438 RepID=UPI0020BD667C|nr:S66 peptidase family protein [Couchioplanes caeruleus]UQU64490.1 LD-carboxypeptidase [Couchioplanes caeruleus]